MTPAHDVRQHAEHVPAAGGGRLSFRVPGRPRSWKRTEGTNGVRYTNAEDRRYRALVGACARAVHRGPPFAGPTRVDVVAVFARPKAKPADVPADVWALGCRVYRPSVPDRDNVEKGVLDALVAARVLSDDAVVVDGDTAKVYAAIGEREGVEVMVRAVGWVAETLRREVAGG